MTGRCYQCHRDRDDVESRPSHAERFLCDDCAARPYQLPRAYEDDVEPAKVPVAVVTTNGRYEGRITDIAALLSKPPQPIPWRVHDVVADGTLTIISGESGAGKSWLVQALCSGVARGRAVAGLPCAKGTAVYVDAEMGPTMFVDQRIRPTGATAPEFGHVDAMGLDLSKAEDLAWLRRDVIEPAGANLLVIDSLRRLTPSKSENDSDDMAPVVAALAKLARDTNTAIVLVHHKGDSEKFFRGSTAIKDQADALFALLRDPDDEDAPRRFRCRGGRGKMRYSLEPADVYLKISPEDGGVVACDPPEQKVARPRDRHHEDVLYLREQGLSVRAIAEKVALSKSSVQRILDCPSVPDPRGRGAGTPVLNGSNGNGWHAHSADEDAPDWWRS